MTNGFPLKVTFYQVKDNPSKLRLVCAKVKEAFLHEKRMIITVPNLQAAQYIEALLWRVPEESFFPHVISDTPVLEWIAITMQNRYNINQANRLLNLCPLPSPLFQDLEEVYDLYDETDPQKLDFSKQRVRFYNTKGMQVLSAKS